MGPWGPARCSCSRAAAPTGSGCRSGEVRGASLACSSHPVFVDTQYQCSVRTTHSLACSLARSLACSPARWPAGRPARACSPVRAPPRGIACLRVGFSRHPGRRCMDLWEEAQTDIDLRCYVLAGFGRCYTLVLTCFAPRDLIYPANLACTCTRWSYILWFVQWFVTEQDPATRTRTRRPRR